MGSGNADHHGLGCWSETSRAATQGSGEPGGGSGRSEISQKYFYNLRNIFFQVWGQSRTSSRILATCQCNAGFVPGGGTYAMEAVARQFARGQDVLVVRNGWFSYRWSQIIESADLTKSAEVMKARMQGNTSPAPFAPAPIKEVTAAIREGKPQVVFAPHVETSSGMILPDDYIKEMAAAAHEVGALMVLDCIASGCVWVDMKALGVDVLISAPQKG